MLHVFCFTNVLMYAIRLPFSKPQQWIHANHKESVPADLHRYCTSDGIQK